MSNKKAIRTDQLSFFTGFAIITLASLLGAIYLEQYLIALVPVIVVLGYISIVDFRIIFYLVLFCLPFSIQYFFEGNTLATDLPVEPLMVGLMFVFILYILSRPDKIDPRFLFHPLIVILGIHYFWMIITTLNAEDMVVSLKFLLAKTWYIIVFVFVAGLILKDQKTFRTAFWVLFIPLFVVTLLILARHAMLGFAYAEVNEAVMPIFRNHVNYSVHLTMLLPFIWIAANWYEKGSFKRRFLIFCRAIFLVAIYFSYTRACWVAILIALVAYAILNWGWLPFAVIASFLITCVFFGYLSYQNQFMQYAPEYRKTLTFEDFDEHIKATYQGQDASTMERFYRWIAAFNMMDRNTLLGYGPGNFYPYYKEYTILAFRTYISDNEDRSTVHNYFLLMLVEQGVIGMLIFVALFFSLFFYCQRLYNSIRERQDRLLATAAILSLAMFFVVLMLNDLVEAAKTGTLFFMNIALLVNLDVKHRISKKNRESLTNSV